MQSVHQNAPARPWWSRSSSNLKQQLQQQSSEKHSNDSNAKQPKKFNTIANAIGFKSRKPAVAIQEPPSPDLPLHTGALEPLPLDVSNQWNELMLEPKMPSDHRHDKHLSYSNSVMTASEIDPFAASLIPTSPRTLASNRISAFSEASTSSSSYKADFTLSLSRQSYTSSSDNSHSYLSHPPPPVHLYPQHPPQSNHPRQQQQHQLRPRVDLSDSAPDVPMDVGTSPELLSPILGPVADPWRVSRLTTSSDKVPRREPPFLSLDAYATTGTGASEPRIRTSPSSSTLTDKPRSADAQVARPPSRPRRMTELGPSTSRSRHPPAPIDPHFLPPQKPPLPTSPPPTFDMRPRSKSARAPPNAPPFSDLPPPPPASSSSIYLRQPSPSGSSSSKSSLVYAQPSRSSSRSSPASSYSHADLPHPGPEPSHAPPPPPPPAPHPARHEFSPTRSLKKAISSQSLRRTSNGSTVMPVPVPTPAPTSRAHEEQSSRGVKKQRSFHHALIPLPPLPTSLRHASSTGCVSTTTRDETQPGSRRASNASQAQPQTQTQTPPSPHGRRRLFSGSNLRRSISSQANSATGTGEDDARSVFSLEEALRGRVQVQVRPTTAPDAGAESFWDDRETENEPAFGNGTGSGSRASAGAGAGRGAAAAHRSVDYAPQHIMSPAEMLRLEASLDGGPPMPAVVREEEEEFERERGRSEVAPDSRVLLRARGMSTTSVATTTSGTFSDVGGSFEGSLLSPPPMSPLSPRSTHSGKERDRPSPSTLFSPMSMSSSMSSLPRSRPVTAESIQRERERSAPPLDIAGLSPSLRPRPRPTKSQPSPTEHRVSIAPVTPLSPPPSWRGGAGLGGLRSRSGSLSSARNGVGGMPPKATISRRPSFLEIEEHAGPAEPDSFLDMGKSSLDTVRSSFDEVGYGR